MSIWEPGKTQLTDLLRHACCVAAYQPDCFENATASKQRHQSRCCGRDLLSLDCSPFNDGGGQNREQIHESSNRLSHISSIKQEKRAHKRDIILHKATGLLG